MSYSRVWILCPISYLFSNWNNIEIGLKDHFVSNNDTADDYYVVFGMYGK